MSEEILDEDTFLREEAREAWQKHLALEEAAMANPFDDYDPMTAPILPKPTPATCASCQGQGVYEGLTGDWSPCLACKPPAIDLRALAFELTGIAGRVMSTNYSEANRLYDIAWEIDNALEAK